MPLCGGAAAAAAAQCQAGTVPVRVNTTASASSQTTAAAASAAWCLQTVCRTPEEATANLTRGAYELFRLGRNAVSGTYVDHVDPRLPLSKQTTLVSTDGTGIGVTAECVAAGLGYITTAEAQERVTLTLRALA